MHTSSFPVSAIIDVECDPEREFGFDRTAMRIARYPEVTDVAVVSGRADLTVMVEAQDMQEISRFVTEILAPMERVKSTATQFFMKTYKQSGKIIQNDPKPSRIPVSL
jgi:DNA-binding Lrp family transcriptional regulator